VNAKVNLERFALNFAAVLKEVDGAEEAAVLTQQNLEFGFVTGRYLDETRLLLRIRFRHQSFPNLMMNPLACETWTLRVEGGVVVSQHKARSDQLFLDEVLEKGSSNNRVSSDEKVRTRICC
jgi:hypothetical protein